MREQRLDRLLLENLRLCMGTDTGCQGEYGGGDRNNGGGLGFAPQSMVRKGGRERKTGVLLRAFRLSRSP